MLLHSLSIAPLSDYWCGWQRQTWHSALIQILWFLFLEGKQLNSMPIQYRMKHVAMDDAINPEIIIIWPVHINTQTLYTGNASRNSGINFCQPLWSVWVEDEVQETHTCGSGLCTSCRLQGKPRRYQARWNQKATMIRDLAPGVAVGGFCDTMLHMFLVKQWK